MRLVADPVISNSLLKPLELHPKSQEVTLEELDYDAFSEIYEFNLVDDLLDHLRYNQKLEEGQAAHYHCSYEITASDIVTVKAVVDHRHNVQVIGIRTIHDHDSIVLIGTIGHRDVFHNRRFWNEVFKPELSIVELSVMVPDGDVQTYFNSTHPKLKWYENQPIGVGK